jgi:hypothetical protein
MNARSLLPILRSAADRQVDPARDHVITGMETHVPCRDLGDGRLGGYPRRSIVTRDFHFIRNFHPARWPAGDPNGCEVPGATPFDLARLCKDTRAAFADVDGGPSKAWLILDRDQPAMQPHFQQVFGKRPARELYDRAKDPHELVNVAGDAAYAAQAQALEARLMAELTAARDPRATGEDPERFEHYAIPKELKKRAP